MTNMEAKEYIKKYDLVLVTRKDGIEGFMPRNIVFVNVDEFNEDKPSMTAMREDIKTILREKKRIKDAEDKADEEKYQIALESGELEITVERISHFSSALDMEITENVLSTDFRAETTIFRSTGGFVRTDLAPGKYKISETPQWQKWKEIRDIEMAKKSYVDVSGKTLVYLNRCWECGVMKITGSANGRMQKEEWKKATDEMRGSVRKLLEKIPGETVLSAAPQPATPGPFDFETDHFIFSIVSTDYCGC